MANEVKIYDGATGEVSYRDFTDKERLESSPSAEKKLAKIKVLRLQHLKETDWWVLRGNITSAQSDYRQNLRNIPENYSEDKYDELLARSDGKLTHSIWEKP